SRGADLKLRGPAGGGALRRRRDSPGTKLQAQRASRGDAWSRYLSAACAAAPRSAPSRARVRPCTLLLRASDRSPRRLLASTHQSPLHRVAARVGRPELPPLAAAP